MSDAMYVKNAVVTDNFWLVEDFFETHADGFVAATQIYSTPSGDVTILFKDREACVIIDEDTGLPASRDELKSVLADMHKQGILETRMEDMFPEQYIQVGSMGVFTDEDTLDNYGFTEEQKQDVIARMDDLEHYYITTEEDMVQPPKGSV